MNRAKKLLAIFTAICMLALLPIYALAEEAGVDGVMPDITEVQIVDVQVGRHTLALDADGNVWAWGLNYYGQWGGGFTGAAPAYTHFKVQGLSDVVQIAVGYDTSYALRADGTVWAWGYNSWGQLGDGTYTNRSLPTQVIEVDNVKEIAAGNHHCLALREDGTVWSWGWNRDGQLGNGSSFGSHNTPQPVSNLDNVTSISAGGDSFSIALRQDGTVWAWGGMVGPQDVKKTIYNTPVKMQRVLNIVEIAAGSNHIVALKEDGTVWVIGDHRALGNNGVGEAGFVQLSLTNIERIIAGYMCSFAQEEDGAIWAWGDNNGQLGLGDRIDRLIPTQLPDSPERILSTQYYSTVFVRADGSIWGCGDNQYGQLRMDDSTTEFLTPIELFGPGTYVGPGVDPVDPPDPVNHTVTVIERYTDGTPDVVNTHEVEKGQSFTASYNSTGSIQNFEVSAADAGVQADFAQRTLGIDAVTRDITITLVFGEGGGDPDPGDITLTNMVRDTGYADLSRWYLSPNIGSMETEGDSLAVTIDNGDSAYYLTVRQDLIMETAHQYYVRSSMYFDEDTFPGATSFQVRLQLGNNSLTSVNYASDWTEISAIGSPSSNGTNRFQQYFRFSPTGSYMGGLMKCRNPMVIDLTEAFGAGNEPSLAWCDENIPFFTGTTTMDELDSLPESEPQQDADEPESREPAQDPDPEPDATTEPGTEPDALNPEQPDQEEEQSEDQADGEADAGTDAEPNTEPDVDLDEPEKPEDEPEDQDADAEDSQADAETGESKPDPEE